MPYKNNYSAILAKKKACWDWPFWPYVSTCLATRLNRAAMTRRFSVFSILDEIAMLEDLPLAKKTGTKPAVRFRGPYLGRFWHKHWTCAAFIEENLRQQWWGGHATKNGSVAKVIREAFEATGKPYGSELTEAELREVTSRMVTQMVSNGYMQRRAREALTGEWLIFYVHNGQNYYLDIATHTKGDDDKRLFERLRDNCAAEFPFAFVD